MFKILTILILVIVSAFLQGTNFNIGGVKPNWILTSLAALAFLEADLFFFSIIVLAAIIVLRYQPAFDWNLTALIIVVFAVFFLGRRLPGREIVNFLFVLILATIGIYLLIDPEFIFRNFSFFLRELIYNLILGMAYFHIFKSLIGKRDWLMQKKITRHA